MRGADQATVDRYFAQGYAILPNWLDAEALETLSQTCDAPLAEPPDDDLGGTAHNIGKG